MSSPFAFEEPPPPTPEERGRLAEAARLTELRKVRGILVTIGVLTIIVNAIMLALIPSQVRDAVNKEVAKVRAQGDEADSEAVEEAVHTLMVANYLFTGVLLACGVIFVVLGLLVHRHPVPIVLTALVLYIALNVGLALNDPATVAKGAIIKIIIVVALFKALQSASAYQREQPAAEPSHE